MKPYQVIKAWVRCYRLLKIPFTKYAIHWHLCFYVHREGKDYPAVKESTYEYRWVRGHDEGFLVRRRYKK